MRLKMIFLLLCLLCFSLIVTFCARNTASAKFEVRDLEYALTVDDPAARLGAVVALQEQGQNGVPGLTTAARDSDSTVRKAAIKALGEVGGQQAADALAELLGNSDATTRIRAIRALGTTGRTGFPYLLRALESEPSPRGRMLAAGVLSNMVQPGDAPAIEERFVRQDAATKMHLVIALVRIGDDSAYAALSRLIDSPDRLVRFYVVNSLTEAAPDARALPIFVNSLDDEATEVRMWGIFGLERLNHPDSYRAVLAALGDEDAYVRKEAAYTLGTLGNKEAIPFLIQSLKDPTTIVRGDAATALGLLGDSCVIEAMQPLLQDPHPGVQIKAAEALAHLGDFSGMETLIGFVDSSTRLYSFEAVRALRGITNQDFEYNKDAWQCWWLNNKAALTNARASKRPEADEPSQ
jgi:HEAT repeat protein